MQRKRKLSVPAGRQPEERRTDPQKSIAFDRINQNRTLAAPDTAPEASAWGYRGPLTGCKGPPIPPPTGLLRPRPPLPGEGRRCSTGWQGVLHGVAGGAPRGDRGGHRRPHGKRGEAPVGVTRKFTLGRSSAAFTPTATWAVSSSRADRLGRLGGRLLDRRLRHRRDAEARDREVRNRLHRLQGRLDGLGQGGRDLVVELDPRDRDLRVGRKRIGRESRAG